MTRTLTKIPPHVPRIILWEIRKLREEFGSFAIKRLRLVSGLGNKVCDENVKKLLKKKGCKFLHSRKKRTTKTKGLERKTKIFQKD